MIIHSANLGQFDKVENEWHLMQVSAVVMSYLGRLNSDNSSGLHPITQIAKQMKAKKVNEPCSAHARIS